MNFNELSLTFSGITDIELCISYSSLSQGSINKLRFSITYVNNYL